MAMFSLANAAGGAFRAALNTVLGKLHGNYYGSTDPSAAAESTPGMLWVDTNGGTPVLKARNASDTGWITLGALDPAAFQLAGTSAFGRSLIDDADATAAHGTLGTLAFLGNKVPTGATDLGASADLNTVTTPGFYFQDSNADAGTGSNYPDAKAGFLEVFNTGAGIVQRYSQYYRSIDTEQPRVWIRSQISSTNVWSPWHTLASAPMDTGFLCRAWVNFNGTGTPSIRASGNVSSITDLGTGTYRVTLANAMPDANYVVVTTVIGTSAGGAYTATIQEGTTLSTTQFTLKCAGQVNNTFDPSYVMVAVFR